MPYITKTMAEINDTINTYPLWTMVKTKREIIMPDYVTEAHCREATKEILENQHTTSVQLATLELLSEQSTDEMRKLRKVIMGNGHIEGSMLYQMKVTEDKIDSHIDEDKKEKEQTIEVSENKKDRNLTMKVLMIGTLSSVVLGILNIIFG